MSHIYTNWILARITGSCRFSYSSGWCGDRGDFDVSASFSLNRPTFERCVNIFVSGHMFYARELLSNDMLFWVDNALGMGI
jgi:hypothetical protein